MLVKDIESARKGIIRGIAVSSFKCFTNKITNLFEQQHISQIN